MRIADSDLTKYRWVPFNSLEGETRSSVATVAKDIVIGGTTQDASLRFFYS
jgi:hypothetical protein